MHTRFSFREIFTVTTKHVQYLLDFWYQSWEYVDIENSFLLRLSMQKLRLSKQKGFGFNLCFPWHVECLCSKLMRKLVYNRWQLTRQNSVCVYVHGSINVLMHVSCRFCERYDFNKLLTIFAVLQVFLLYRNHVSIRCIYWV